MTKRMKFEDWFECILLIPPKIIIVSPQEEADDSPWGFEVGDDTWHFLMGLFSDEIPIGIDYDREDVLKQSLEYWMSEKAKLIAELQKFGKDYLSGPISINIVKTILYYDRSIKFAIDKYLDYKNKARAENGTVQRMTVADLPKPAMAWIPQFDAEILERFCEVLTPEVSDAYVLECFNPRRENKAEKKKAKSKGRKLGRPSGKSKKTILRHNWIRDRYYALQKKRKFHKLDEAAGLIRSEMMENPPTVFEKGIYEKSTILKVLKSRSWGDD